MGELVPHSLDANLTRCTSSPASPLSFFYVEPVQAQLLQLGLSLHSGRRALAVRHETGAAEARRPS